MGLYSRFYRSMVLPALDLVLGTRRARYGRVLTRHLASTTEQLRALQLAKLQELVTHAGRSVPFYRRRFEQCGFDPSSLRSLGDLQRIPVLRKDDITAHFADLLDPGFPSRKRRTTATGGSTGEPLRFATTSDVDSWRVAAQDRHFQAVGCTPGDRHVLIWGSKFDHSYINSFSGRLTNRLARCTYLFAHDFNDAVIDRYRATINTVRPHYIRGYTLALAELAHAIEADDTTTGPMHSPQCIITAAETLYPRDRTAIETVFDCPVIDYYATRETSMSLCQCMERGGYHDAIENAVVEVVDENGDPVAPGERGFIVVTDLNNFGMPFIRYRLEDMGLRAARERCPCGSPLPLTLDRVEGRVSDYVIKRDGTKVHPITMMYLIYPDPSHYAPITGLKQYQFVQEAVDEFTVNLVLEDGVSLADFAYLRANFRAVFGAAAAVKLNDVDEIGTGASGKRRYIISHLDRQD